MQQDAYAGQGGSYTQDPKTGKRTRTEQPTEHPAEAASLLDNAAVAAVVKPAAPTNKGE
jgi:hypothetical protein